MAKNLHSKNFYGKKWYYYLNNPEKDQSLFNAEIIGPYSLVVQYEKIKDQDRVQKSNRLYATFKNYVEYIQYIQNIPPHLRHFSEVILGNNPCKPYFDIDGPYIPTEKERLKFLNNYLEVIIDVLTCLGNTIDVENDIFVFDSSGSYERNEMLKCDKEAKTSYHIVVQGICNSSMHVREIFKLVYNSLSVNLKEYLDPSVYSKNHCMRMLGNTKAKSQRVKRFMPSYMYKGQEILTIIDCLDADEENLTIFEKSLITCIYGNLAIKSPEPVVKDIKEELDTADNVDINDFTEKLNVVIQGLEVIKGQGSFMFLNNKNGYFCPFCTRVHENENPYVLIKEDGSMYFSCRRNPEWQLCYIGKLDNFKPINPTESTPTSTSPKSSTPTSNVPTTPKSIPDPTPSIVKINDVEQITPMPRLKRARENKNDISPKLPNNATSSNIMSKIKRDESEQVITVNKSLKVKPKQTNQPNSSKDKNNYHMMPKIGHKMRKNVDKQRNKEQIQKYHIESYKYAKDVTENIRDVRKHKLENVDNPITRECTMSIFDVMKNKNNRSRSFKLNNSIDEDTMPNFFSGQSSTSELKSKETENVINLYNIMHNK